MKCNQLSTCVVYVPSLHRYMYCMQLLCMYIHLYLLFIPLSLYKACISLLYAMAMYNRSIIFQITEILIINHRNQNQFCNQLINNPDYYFDYRVEYNVATLSLSVYKKRARVACPLAAFQASRNLCPASAKPSSICHLDRESTTSCSTLYMALNHPKGFPKVRVLQCPS